MQEKEGFLQKVKIRESELHEECEKYANSTQELFDQIDQLSAENDELRDQQINQINTQPSSSADSRTELVSELKKLETNQQLLSDYAEQVKELEAENKQLRESKSYTR